MGMQYKGLAKFLKDNLEKELKSELKANRKRDGKWEKIPGIYPCPCQCLAVRSIAPRGKQQLFRTVKGEIKATSKIRFILENLGWIK